VKFAEAEAHADALPAARETLVATAYVTIAAVGYKRSVWIVFLSIPKQNEPAR
jgi:hypothetical protein